MPQARQGPDSLADRKSTRLNSSHGYISYAVFCLKKKKKTKTTNPSHQGLKLHTLSLPRSLAAGLGAASLANMSHNFSASPSTGHGIISYIPWRYTQLTTTHTHTGTSLTDSMYWFCYLHLPSPRYALY